MLKERISGENIGENRKLREIRENRREYLEMYLHSHVFVEHYIETLQ